MLKIDEKNCNNVFLIQIYVFIFLSISKVFQTPPTSLSNLHQSQFILPTLEGDLQSTLGSFNQFLLTKIKLFKIYYYKQHFNILVYIQAKK
jgi:hypothetical protein